MQELNARPCRYEGVGISHEWPSRKEQDKWPQSLSTCPDKSEDKLRDNGELDLRG